MAKHLPRSEFQRFPETPVELIPYNPQLGIIAQSVQAELNALLIPWSIASYFFGSAALKILGKNEVEFAIFVSVQQWNQVYEVLEKSYGRPVSTTNNRARFEYDREGAEIEIVLCDESERALTMTKTEYLLAHPEELERYVAIKVASAYSKREYLYQKNEFFAQITEKIIASDN